MKRAATSEPSSFGRDATLRMTHVMADTLARTCGKDDRKEQMAFGLARQAKTAEGTVFLISQLILPDNMIWPSSRWPLSARRRNTRVASISWPKRQA